MSLYHTSTGILQGSFQLSLPVEVLQMTDRVTEVGLLSQVLGLRYIAHTPLAPPLCEG